MHSCTHSVLFKLHEQLGHINRINSVYHTPKPIAQDVKAARGQGLGITSQRLNQSVRNWIVAVVAYPLVIISPCLSWSYLS